ncbi:hypothetical protein NH8B_1906 [Pseudogulbenkiania sp. NH8B]|uniref:hypothetical protein n=1 Tax=Pseudogulbenkiania sp. (strain NH8B) TaxID=748280 RepID=UPI0002279F6A|nr:hypothetical protein [Pseudogulbenkiania sp. NH8B]BAK76721.1 hypothetical protein NH8B_1906 [Pseudogulbenkiania sp. NH8B]
MKLSSPFVPRLSLPGSQPRYPIKATIRKSFPWPLLPMQPMAATWEELEAYPLDILVIDYVTGKPTQIFITSLFNRAACLEYLSLVVMPDSQNPAGWHKGRW